MDGKTAPRNRKKPSGSTLTDKGRKGIQGSSGYGNACFSRAAESQNIPMPTPFTQARPHPSRRLSEYTAMVLAVDEIPVGLSSILLNANALSLRLIENIPHIRRILRMDLVGWLLGAACDFRECE
jgi:hypothetical protein